MKFIQNNIIIKDKRNRISFNNQMDSVKLFDNINL